MRQFRSVLVVSVLAVAAPLTMAANALSAPEPEAVALNPDEISAAQRHYHRRYVPRTAPAGPRYYGRGNDPSIGPDGRPYPVPEYLRNQCYIDEGYGRFSACQNR